MIMSSINHKTVAPGAGDRLPEGPLIAWYGDDFTGAAAVMEVLTFAGLPSVLFLETPTPERLGRFPGLRGVGIATTARAETPAWMSAELPDAFARLAALGAPLLHYKVCSTLDSAPEIGSIGRAIEIGARTFSTGVVPVVVAAPEMRRFQFQGHLFAGLGDMVYRLDRHPVMSRHPVTPMNESDVALHISRQSDRIAPALLSLDALRAGSPLPEDTGDRITVCAIDTIDRSTDAAAGRVIWEARDRSPFVVGSQGVEYALVAHWRKTGAIDRIAPPAGLGLSLIHISEPTRLQ